MAEHKRRARWRLLGAFIIAGAVAVVAPVLLEEQARPLSQDLLIDIPSKNSAFGKIDTLKPVASDEKAADEKTAEPKAVEPKAVEPKAVETKAVEPKVAVSKSVAAAKPTSAGVVVQVGAYASMEAANTVKAKLTSGGHKVVIEPIKADDGTDRYRVRIGPFDTREQAVQVRDRAKAQGYDAMVVNP